MLFNAATGSGKLRRSRGFEADKALNLFYCCIEHILFLPNLPTYRFFLNFVTAERA